MLVYIRLTYELFPNSFQRIHYFYIEFPVHLITTTTVTVGIVIAIQRYIRQYAQHNHN